MSAATQKHAAMTLWAMTQGPARWEKLVSGQLRPCWPEHSVAFATPRWVAPRWWEAGEQRISTVQPDQGAGGRVNLQDFSESGSVKTSSVYLTGTGMRRVQ